MRTGQVARRQVRVATAGWVVAALALVGCGEASSPPAAATSDTGTAEPADSPDAAERCAAAAAVEYALASLEDAGEVHRDGATEAADVDPQQIREGTDAMLALVDATDRLGELVDPDQQAALVAWVAPQRQLAELYRDLDYDLGRLDPDDDDQMGRLDATFGDVLMSDEQLDTLDALLAELSASCPGVDLGGDGQMAVRPDLEDMAGGHTVTLSEKAVADIEAEAAITRETLAGGDSPSTPCPLWDPEVIVAAAGDLLDERIELSDTVTDRQGGGELWSYSCGSRDGRPDGIAGPQGLLRVSARLLDEAGTTFDGTTPQQAGGHAVYVATPTDGRHTMFAIDAERNLLLSVRAETEQLADVVLIAVLDELTDGN
jgi:hypothetical protein